MWLASRRVHGSDQLFPRNNSHYSRHNGRRVQSSRVVFWGLLALSALLLLLLGVQIVLLKNVFLASSPSVVSSPSSASGNLVGDNKIPSSWLARRESGSYPALQSKMEPPAITPDKKETLGENSSTIDEHEFPPRSSSFKGDDPKQKYQPPKRPTNADKKPIAPNKNKIDSYANNITFWYDQPLLLEDFPPWIQDYVEWHARMRKQFPGMALLEDPEAPGVLVRTCLGLCGGLHDRLGQLPWDLYLANQTQRVLLLAWQRPRALEEFLVPNHPEWLDWRVPPEAPFGFNDMHSVRNHTGLFLGYPEDHPTEEFWRKDIDAVLARANRRPAGEQEGFADIKILRHRLLGHLGEDYLQERLEDAALVSGRAEDAAQVHSYPHFGNIFWLFFRPSLPVRAIIEQILSDLQLATNTGSILPSLFKHTYTAVHCRVRHPKATDYSVNVVGKNPRYPADKTGLPWIGATRQFALEVATKALECSREISAAGSNSMLSSTPNPHRKKDFKRPSQTNTTERVVYFMSDSNDLVRHVSVELQDEAFVRANRSEIDKKLYEVVVAGSEAIPAFSSLPSSAKNITDGSASSISSWVRARNVDEETAHLDRQKGRPPPAYYSTFVDLMLAIHAECVVYGIGYYAAFAAKISGTRCRYVYQQEAWGSQAMKQARVCPNTINSKNKNEDGG